ncbi:hypothetical protein [Mycoplasmopsis alligatoris]|uniref:Conserved domain protein n=1 Tax=Mycoplasmopsis alligatoris A21JP2 TaxID=747682 RepID=D4XWX5_9BACT|nr:hypothetical protein [Mycoplasmopsis alligatoris]EFF41176.1 conserved domain protein [Mycoplasmopsis alligatoris A21JP2]
MKYNFLSNFSLKSTSLTDPTPTNITLWILSSVLIIVLIGVIIWRIFIVNKKDSWHNQKNLAGSVSKSFLKVISDLSYSEKIDVLVNIGFKNKYAKKEISLIPALIRRNNKLFLITNLVENKANKEIIIKNNKLYYDSKNYYANIDLYWNFEIIKFISKELIQDVEIQNIVLTKNEFLHSNGDSNFLISTIYNLIEIMDKQIIKEISDNDFKKIKDKFLSLNLNKNSGQHGI